MFFLDDKGVILHQHHHFLEKGPFEFRIGIDTRKTLGEPEGRKYPPNVTGVRWTDKPFLTPNSAWGNQVHETLHSGNRQGWLSVSSRPACCT